jgi:hypothetical protein
LFGQLFDYIQLIIRTTIINKNDFIAIIVFIHHLNNPGMQF